MAGSSVALRGLCRALLCKATDGAATTGHSFITTPIFYVNAAPHIGHLYSAVLADAAHRWQVMKGADPAIFSTGTDEHGQKIQQAATSKGYQPQELCDKVSNTFKELFSLGHIGYTDFIRTTQANHKEAVEALWRKLYDEGYIYRGRYEGWYCVSDEVYVASSRVQDGPNGTKTSVETGNTLQWYSEDNYIFRLSAFQKRLKEWVGQNPSPVVPCESRHLLQMMLSGDKSLDDISVSRPSSRLSWGIPVPNDPSQTIYVWLDALVNYLTVSGYPASNRCWPATVHVVGKDILKFHAIYWPAFLMAAGLELPKKVVSHAHWTHGKIKMSKSRGNVVDPFSVMEKFGVEALRYLLLKDGSYHHDGDYSEERLIAILNSDLADTLGNLILRITSKKLNPWGPEKEFHKPLLSAITPSGDEDKHFFDKLQSLPDYVDKCYESFEFGKGISAVFEILDETNRYVDRHQPWVMVKRDHSQLRALQQVLEVVQESLRTCAVLLHPTLPDSTLHLLQTLGCHGDDGASNELSDKGPLHMRLQTDPLYIKH